MASTETCKAMAAADEQKSESLANMNRKCEECSESAWKYRCPRCDLKTCSLQCSRAHKTRLNCSGKRNKAEFVKLEDFDNKVLHSDFNFLEEVLRCADSCKRISRGIQGGQPARNYEDLQESTLTEIGVSKATERGKPDKFRSMLIHKAAQKGVELLLVPRGMQRQLENTTFYDVRRKRIRWRVEFIFSQCNARVVESKMSDGCTIQMILEKILEPFSGELIQRKGSKKMKQNSHSENELDNHSSEKSGHIHKFCPSSTPIHYYSAVVRQKLQPYTDAGVSNLGAFLKMNRNRETNESHRVQLAHNVAWRGSHGRGGGGGGGGRQGRRGRGRGRGGRNSHSGFVSRTSLALEAKNSQREISQFARIDLKEQLGTALERVGAVIIEFPTIHIALPSETASYASRSADDSKLVENNSGDGHRLESVEGASAFPSHKSDSDFDERVSEESDLDNEHSKADASVASGADNNA